MKKTTIRTPRFIPFVSKSYNLHFFLWNNCAIGPSARNHFCTDYQQLITDRWDDFNLLCNKLAPLLETAKKKNPKFNSEISLALLDTGKLPDKYSYLENIYREADHYFAPVWQIAKLELEQQSKTLKNALLLQDHIEFVEHDLETFFGTKPDNEDMRVVLRFSPEIYQGGSCLDSHTIALEKRPLVIKKDIVAAWLLILHEYIHAQFENVDITKNKLRKYLEKREKTPLMQLHGPRVLFGELLVSCFASTGYLAIKYFERNWTTQFEDEWGKILNGTKKVSSIDLNPLRNLARLRLVPVITEYIISNKQFDDFFLDQLYTIIKEYEKAAL